MKKRPGLWPDRFFFTCAVGSGNRQFDVDVAAGRVRVRADLVSRVDQLLLGVGIQARQRDRQLHGDAQAAPPFVGPRETLESMATSSGTFTPIFGPTAFIAPMKQAA